MAREAAAYAALLDRLPVGVCVAGPKGRVLYHNDAARGILGLPGRLEGKDLCALLCGRLACGGSTGLAACPFKRTGSRARQAVLRGTYAAPPAFRWRLVAEEMLMLERRTPMTVVCAGAAGRRRVVWLVPLSAGRARGSP